MFEKWLYDFSSYFNQGSSPSLKMKGPYIEASLTEASRVFFSKYQMDPFSQSGNFERYWGLVQFSLTQKGISHQEFEELSRLAKSFNEGMNWV